MAWWSIRRASRSTRPRPSDCGADSPMSEASLPRAVLFDLLTALLDSWALWAAVAGSQSAGRAWRAEYLRLTYGSGAYVPYEQLVRDAARTVGLPASVPQALEDRWLELKPWSGVRETLGALAG